MPSFDQFIDALRENLSTYAEEQWEEFKKEAVKDGRAFAKEAAKDLARWTSALAKGDLSSDDFKWLLKSKKALFELNALKTAGLSKARLARFVNGVIDLVVDTAIKTFL
jgi:hypothetical protein